MSDQTPERPKVKPAAAEDEKPRKQKVKDQQTGKITEFYVKTIARRRNR